MALSRVPYLVDKSALARMRHTAIAEVLAPLLEGGQVAVTAVLELEVLYSARNERDFVATHSELLAYPHLAVVPDDFERAIDVMSLLARRGQHRAADLPDLLQAAVAERHAVTLLHYDSDFDLIAAVTGQPMQWVVPRGSVT